MARRKKKERSLVDSVGTMYFTLLSPALIVGVGLLSPPGEPETPVEHGYSEEATAELVALLSPEQPRYEWPKNRMAVSIPLRKPVEPVAEGETTTPAITDRFIHKVAMAESSGNPNAKAAQGTASGLFGFIDETWRSMVERHGKAHGIRLKDKHHPRAQRVMVRLLLEENAAILAKLLDRAPTHGEIYIGHVFGPKKAAELIEAKGTGKLAKNLFSQNVVKSNRPIFWNGKRPRTVEEVYRLLDGKVA